MARRIQIYPQDETVLRTICKPVEKFEATGGALGDLASDLLGFMRTHNGQGLAANQIGDTRRVIVVQLREFPFPEVMVNPWFQAWSEHYLAGQEGCLSFPGMYINGIKRRDFVCVHYSTIYGDHRSLNLYDNDARVVQHEVDHLDGVLIIDRVHKIIADGALKKYLRTRKKNVKAGR